MKIVNTLILVLLVLVLEIFQVPAQFDSGVKRLSTSSVRSYTSDTSGDGRFVMIESDGDIATYNPRNADRNYEIFLFDVAQRHIFQITDTKSATQSTTCPQTEGSNIRVAIDNSNVQISNDGKWIVFSSNATSSVAGSTPNGTNPGNFDANQSSNLPNLLQDGNEEIWLYQMPTFQTVDLSSGDVPTFVNLDAGTFIQVTNTPTSRAPVAGSCTNGPLIAQENYQGTINDDGTTVAFLSVKDIVPGGNAPPSNNDEVYIYKRLLNSFAQVTRTPRGSAGDPIICLTPSISGDGTRVAFASNATNPVIGMSGGSNTDISVEIYFSDLNFYGEPDGIKRQVTNITRIDYDWVTDVGYKDRSISRDGRYIVFETRARLDGNGSVGQGFADFIYDSQSSSSNPFTRFTPYSNADSSVPVLPGYERLGGDPFRHPTFTGYEGNSLTPSTITFTSRMNFRADGSIPPAGSTEGLNPISPRPIQVHSYNFTSSSPLLKRISNSSLLNPVVNSHCSAANLINRIACTFVSGTGDAGSYYLLTPNVTQEDAGTSLQFFTGAGALAVGSNSQGLMPNMLGSVVYSSPLVQYEQGFASQVSNSRNPTAPLQLKGISLTIDGISANITGVTNGRINFIIPKGVTPGNKAVVINHKGIILRGNVQIIQTPQPDIVRTDNISLIQNYSELIPQPYGRARILNVTDPNNLQPEPFGITTQTPGGTVPTKLRIFLTGVQGVTANAITIKLGNVTIPTGSITTNAVETDYPGIFTFDFYVPPQLDGAGHVPVVVTVNGQSSRTVGTASRIRFLSSQPSPTDLAVWRPGNGTWYILDDNGANPIYVQWGTNGDTPAQGDYDGDGKTDFCIFRPSTGDWWLVRSSDNTSLAFHFGVSGDEAAQADYDGDGKTDFAVWRPSTKVWYIYQSSTNSSVSAVFGTGGDKPVPADYDGDGKADLAVWRSDTATFWVQQSLSNQSSAYSIGQADDKPAIGDYDGDGRADFATYRANDNTWRILNRNNSQISVAQIGDSSTDITVQGDYDGDGKTDIAIWKSSGSLVGWWFIKKSSNGQIRSEKWGTTGDIPVAAPW